MTARIPRRGTASNCCSTVAAGAGWRSVADMPSMAEAKRSLPPGGAARRVKDYRFVRVGATEVALATKVVAPKMPRRIMAFSGLCDRGNLDLIRRAALEVAH